MSDRNGLQLADAMCISCGEVTADAVAGQLRCPRCRGRVFRTTTQDMVDVAKGVQHAARPVPPPTLPAPAARPVATEATPPAFQLPATTRTKRWLDETRALAEAFKNAGQEAEATVRAREKEFEQQIAALREEAQRYRNAASVCDQILKQVAIAESTKPDTRTRRVGKTPGRGWKTAECGGCKETKPIFAAGLCMACHRARRTA